MSIGMNELHFKVAFLVLHMVKVLNCDDWHFQGLNVARGQTARQYPLILDNQGANLAVDGNTGSCARTDAQHVNEWAWWRVDLNKSFIIKGIRIYTSNGNLKGFYVNGSSDSGHVQLYHDVTAPVHQVINITVTVTAPFHSIKIVVPASLSTRSYLTLCEVQIFPFADQRLPCKRPPLIQHGRYLTYKTEYYTGETESWTCDDGYSPKTLQYITCTDVSIWSPPQPRCLPVQTCPYILLEHGHCIDQTGQQVIWGYSADQTIQEEPQGYRAERRAIQKNLRSHGFNNSKEHDQRGYSSIKSGHHGQQSNNNDKSGYQGQKTNSSVKSGQKDQRSADERSSSVGFAVDTTLAVICEEGFESPVSVIRCLSVDTSVVWDTNPTCEQITCKELEDRDILGGYYVYTAQNIMPSRRHACGTTASVVCSQNFTLPRETNSLTSPEKSNLLTCGTSGTWIGKRSYCVPTCPLPEALHGTYEDGKGRILPAYALGQTVRLRCDSGYELHLANFDIARAVRTCLSSHTWDGDSLQCTEVLRPCPLPPDIQHVLYQKDTSDYYPGNLVSWKCGPGYFPQTARNLTCTQSSTWSTPLPSCSRMTCSYPGHVSNGHFIDQLGKRYTSSTPSSAVVGTLLTVVCATGFKPSVPVIQCTYNSTSSGWNASTSCTQITCSQPSGRIRGGRFVYSSTAVIPSQRYIYGTTATVVCRQNFNLSGQGHSQEASPLRCGGSGMWVGKHSSCVPTCLAPKLVHGAYTDEKGHTVSSYVAGHTAWLRCNDGYEINNGTSDTVTVARRCLRNHTWNGTSLQCTVAYGRHGDFRAKAVAAIMGTIGGGFLLGALVVILIIFVNRFKIWTEIIMRLTGLRVFRRVFPAESAAA